MTDRIMIDAKYPLYEMAKVFYINRQLKPKQESVLSLWVYTNEGESVPHLHVRRTGEKDACIKFYKAEYFIHGDNTGTLTTDECEWLDDMLKLKMSSGRTFWEYAIDSWNTANAKRDKTEIPYNLKQPDYTKLNK